jgi:DDE superfamily endonuclease
MRALPPKMVQVLAPFVPLFSKRIFKHAQVLLMGAILAPGRRTVSSALRAMGLYQHKRFHRYHRVLSRASWSSLEASRVLLGLLVEAFVPQGGPLLVGIDETLERRYGKKISARGVYRDPVRSTHENFLKSSGLRWVCAMLLVEVPWASRVWALPFLSALAPAERYASEKAKRRFVPLPNASARMVLGLPEAVASSDRAPRLPWPTPWPTSSSPPPEPAWAGGARFLQSIPASSPPSRHPCLGRCSRRPTTRGGGAVGAPVRRVPTRV